MCVLMPTVKLILHFPQKLTEAVNYACAIYGTFIYVHTYESSYINHLSWSNHFMQLTDNYFLLQ